MGKRKQGIKRKKSWGLGELQRDKSGGKRGKGVEIGFSLMKTYKICYGGTEKEEGEGKNA